MLLSSFPRISNLLHTSFHLQSLSSSSFAFYTSCMHMCFFFSLLFFPPPSFSFPLTPFFFFLVVSFHVALQIPAHIRSCPCLSFSSRFGSRSLFFSSLSLTQAHSHSHSHSLFQYNIHNRSQQGRLAMTCSIGVPQSWGPRTLPTRMVSSPSSALPTHTSLASLYPSLFFLSFPLSPFLSSILFFFSLIPLYFLFFFPRFLQFFSILMSLIALSLSLSLS